MPYFMLREREFKYRQRDYISKCDKQFIYFNRMKE